ncbi:MAG: helix-turn-helix domain-containing protein [Lachnospiraceae bacterium]|nr:helix-turn-helix domain-containing protein [Lachnospiraceae bacterium]
MTLAQKLIKLRKEKKMSQKDVAEKMGVHYNTYSRFERGTTIPTAKNYQKLAEVLGCPVAYLTGAPDEAKENKPAAAPAAAAEPKTEAAKPAAEAKAEPKTAKKTAAKKPVKKPAAKKPAAAKKQTAKASSEQSFNVNIELQYAGKSIPYTELVEKALSASGSDGKDLNIYIKPEENRVYYVVNGNPGSFEI